MVIFVEFFAVKYIFHEIFCFPARNLLYTLEEVETMLYVSAPVTYKPNIANSHLVHFIHFGYYFSKNGNKAFYSSCYIIEKSIDVLPKSSTPLDQNSGLESIHSPLSVAIFKAPRNHPRTRLTRVRAFP